MSHDNETMGSAETVTSHKERPEHPVAQTALLGAHDSATHHRELAAYRALMIAACVALPVFGLIHGFVRGTGPDAMPLRWIFSAFAAVVITLSYTNRHVRKHALHYGFAVLYALTAIVFLLLYQNAFDLQYFVGVFLVFVSVSLFTRSNRQQILYCTVCIAAITFLGILESDGRAVHYLALMAVWSIIAYVSLSARLSMQEELRTTTSLLQTTFDSTCDGIVIMDENRVPLGYNQAFAKMWNLATKTDGSTGTRAVLQAMLDQMEDPDSFVARVNHFYAHPDVSGDDLVAMKDGRILHRNTQPRWVDGVPIGRVWVFRDITEQKHADEALRESEARYRALVEDQVEAVCRWLPDTTLTFVNQAYQRLFGALHDPLLGRRWIDFLPETEKAYVQEFYQSLVDEPRISTHEHEVFTSDGCKRYMQWTDCPVFDADGNLTEFQSVGRDLTDLRESEAALLLRTGAMNATVDHILLVDAEGVIAFANQSIMSETGYRNEEIVGKTFEFFRPQTGDTSDYDDMIRATTGGIRWRGELRSRRKNGECFVTDVTVTPVKGMDGEVENFIAVGRNIKERRAFEEKLSYQARHDQLTGLPNRLCLTEYLSNLLSPGRRKVDQLAVLLVDLDQFKIINDSLGHNVGDRLIVAVSERLKCSLRDSDMLARMGGDEFAVILRNLSRIEDANDVAHRILGELTQPFEVDGNRLVIGASIGLSAYPTDGTDADSLLKNADAAMYRVKESGRNSFAWYTRELNAANVLRLDMERDLRFALERNELKVYYQPIIDVKSEQLAGAEALLRWEHPEKGVISPAVFIPVAEETNLIVPIGDYVLRTACAQSRHWQKMGHPPVVMAVNVSVHQLRRSEWITSVRDIIAETGMDPSHLNLELTESTLTINECQHARVLNEIKEMGVLLSIDDFGTGYSSLGRLKDFPIIHIKIDGSFLRDIAHAADDRTLAESIVAMAHNLDIRVTAEWVESEQQMEIVRSIGCDYAQGYLISPPLPVDKFEDFMRARTRSSDQHAA